MEIDKLRQKIKDAAKIINKTIEERAMIIIRHHADCDGYCGALAIEEVILPIIKNENRKHWQKYKRLPMKAPFYAYADAIKDISHFKESLDYDKKPLLILVDNGCGEEDIVALKKLKIYNINIIILDHHIFSKETEKIVNLHINPRIVGGEGDVTSGMIGYEVANEIGQANSIYAALSGVSDKSKEEVLNHYLKLAKQNKDFLEKLARCVDFEAYNLKFMESDIIYDLFNDKQNKTMNIILPEIEKKIENQKKVIKKFLKEDKIKKGKLFMLDLKKTTSFGEYPTPGKIVGIAHRMNKGPRVTLGIAEDLVTFRIDKIKFSVTKILEELKKKLPYGNINGGGHDYAGTIKFIPGTREQVSKEIVKFLKE